MNKKIFLMLFEMIFIFGILGSVQAAAPSANGTAAYYPFQNTTGSVIDSTGVNNGTISGGVTRGVTGIYQNGFSFDGSSGYVNLGSSFSGAIYGSTAFSISLWFNQNVSEQVSLLSDHVAGGDSGTAIILRNNQLYYNFGSTLQSWDFNEGTLNTGTWYNYVLTYESGIGFKLYKNGNLQDSSGVISGTIKSQARSLLIGADNGNGNNINGKIDEVGIFNYALSPSEISYLYNSGSPRGAQQYPFIGLGITPTYPTNNSYINNSSPNFNATITNAGVTVTGTTFNLYNSNGTLINNQSKSYSTTSSFNESYTDGTLTEGTYKYNINAQSASSNATTGNITFTIDTHPPTINTTSPTGTYNYLYTGKNLTLNTTISDNFAISSAWYSYNGTNHTISVTNGTLYSQNISYQGGKNNLTVYANDSVGNLASQTTSWTPLFTEVSQSYSTSTYETSNENFTLNFNKDSSVTSFTGTFNYNGKSYSAHVGCSSTCLQSTIQIPSGISSGVFNWTVNFSTSSSNYSATSQTYNQTVNSLSFEKCTTPTGLALNFTTYDVQNLTRLNSSFQSTFQFQLNSGSVYKSYNYQDLNENTSNWMFCLNSGGENVTLNSFTSYYATGYDRRNYIISNGTIGNFTQNIPLYLASTASTDIVSFYVYDENQNPLSNAEIMVQRWDVGTNSYDTVNMFNLDQDGQGTMNMQLYNTYYRYIIIYNGKVVETTSAKVVSSTTQRIQVQLGVENPYSYFGTIGHSLTFDNSTNYTQFSWTDTSGYTQQGCLKISKDTSLGSQVLSTQCLSSVSGILNYYLNGTGTYTAQGIIYLNSSKESKYQVVNTTIITLGTPSRNQAFSGVALVSSLLIIGTVGLIGASAGSIVFGAFLIGISSYLLFLIGWINLPTGGLYALISILIIIIYRSNRGS